MDIELKEEVIDKLTKVRDEIGELYPYLLDKSNIREIDKVIDKLSKMIDRIDTTGKY